MKKHLLIIFLSICLHGVHAQSLVYHPFPTDSATWMMEGISTGSYYYDRYYQLGDTTIGTFNYHKIYKTSTFGFMVGGSPDNYYNSKYFAGALREDINNKKVYYYSEFKGTEELLYDFNLNVGNIAFSDSIGSNIDTIIVSGIDSVIVGGIQHKRFLLQNISLNGNLGTPGNWIEGLGSESGLLEKFRYGFEFSHQLVCFSENGNYEYIIDNGWVDYLCSYEVGINELIGNKINLRFGPNPSSGVVTLSISCKETYSVEVLTSLGNIIWCKHGLNLEFTSIDITEFASGIYIVRLKDSKGNCVSKKIIKE